MMVLLMAQLLVIMIAIDDASDAAWWSEMSTTHVANSDMSAYQKKHIWVS